MLSIKGRRWEIRKRAPSAFFAAMPDVPPLALQLLHNRDYVDAESIAELLANAEPPNDPFLMSGMEKAVARVLRAINARESICVYADYDADGVCGAAVLVSALRSLGAEVHPYFPSRLEEGYGLNQAALRSIRALGVSLVISTDCGANAVEEVALAVQLGLDVVITDHHVVNVDLPMAAAALNPRSPGEPYPFPDLAGAGVAYKLAEAVLLEADSPAAVEVESLLDFVALATVADVVPIRGENRWVVNEGLRLINDRPRPGFRALIEAAGLGASTVRSRDLAFRLGPRINASGRMQDARLSFDLLLASDSATADGLARELNDLNRLRQQATEQVLRDATAAAGDGEVVVAHGAEWPLGVLGLVAGRITADTGRPAYISSGLAGEVRGSARGPEGFDVIASLQACERILAKFGGHRRAAGFSMQAGRLEEFHAQLRRHWEELPVRPDTTPTLAIDCRLLPASVSWETHDIKTALEPYGEGFPEPIFMSNALTLGRAHGVGDNQKHLRLTFEEMSNAVSAIWFGMGTVADDLKAGTRYDVVFRIASSTFRGEMRIDMLVEDMRLAV